MRYMVFFLTIMLAGCFPTLKSKGVSSSSTTNSATSSNSAISYFLSLGQIGVASVSSSAVLGNAYSGSNVAMSADGRFIVFNSSATNLVAGDVNGQDDIFIYDQLNQTTRLVSVTAGGVQGNGGSYNPTVSADGRYVAFSSIANNLAVDTNGMWDVFLKDMTTGVVTLISVNTAGTQGATNSDHPHITPDGRYVEFESQANNWSGADTNNDWDIFVRDLQLNTTTAASVSSGGVYGNTYSYGGSISDNGRYVIFTSTATNLVAGDTNAKTDVFLRDMTLNTTTRISVDSAATQSNNDSDSGFISGDGKFAVFSSTATNLIGVDTNGAVKDIYLRDLTLNTTAVVSVSSAGTQANATSDYAKISGDSNYIVFSSAATNLVASDTNGSQDVFIRSLQSSTTFRASTDISNTEANGSSDTGMLSSDGTYVLFTSSATNLISSDTNATQDVFIKRIR